MINRKRQHTTQKLNLDSCKQDVIYSNDELCENDILTKYLKYQSVDNEFIKSYLATPGECTRSKTVVSYINPFDLSNPEPKNTNFNNFISSIRKGNNQSKNQIINFCDESLDSGFETESILSFASRSNEEDSNSIQSMASNTSWPLDNLSELKPICSPVKNCSETGYLLPLVTDTSDVKVFLPQISPLTLANLLSGNHTLNNNIRIFDCRFPYEYAGGHIFNAVNVYTCQKLLQTLFNIKECDSNQKLEEDINDLRKKLKRDKSIYIFYCEFSSYRAPKLARCLRGLDRLVHINGRDLSIPNIYVMHGGYRDFYNEFPQFCTPMDYVPMKQSRYPFRHSFMIDLMKEDEIGKNKYRMEEKKHFQEMKDSEKILNYIISKSTKDGDILKLFLSHPIIGGN